MKIPKKFHPLAEMGAEGLAAVVAVVVGVVLFGQHFAAEGGVLREIVTSVIGAIAGFAVAVPVMRWQARRKRR